MFHDFVMWDNLTRNRLLKEFKNLKLYSDPKYRLLWFVWIFDVLSSVGCNF